MIQFEHIESLYLLGLIPILILAIFLYSRWRKKNLLKFSTANLHKQINNKRSSFRINLKHTLQVFSIIFLIIGISNPKIGSEIKEEEYEGIEIIIALDVSNSMLCEDIRITMLIPWDATCVLCSTCFETVSGQQSEFLVSARTGRPC